LQILRRRDDSYDFLAAFFVEQQNSVHRIQRWLPLNIQRMFRYKPYSFFRTHTQE
jgi:hypothetical protein